MNLTTTGSIWVIMSSSQGLSAWMVFLKRNASFITRLKLWWLWQQNSVLSMTSRTSVCVCVCEVGVCAQETSVIRKYTRKPLHIAVYITYVSLLPHEPSVCVSLCSSVGITPTFSYLAVKHKHVIVYLWPGRTVVSWGRSCFFGRSVTSYFTLA